MRACTLPEEVHLPARVLGGDWTRGAGRPNFRSRLLQTVA
jgi:hypothetical protein